MQTITETKPMTEGQRNFMKALLTQKFESDTAEKHIAWLDSHTMSVYRASEKIDQLKAMPDVNTPAELEIGMYRVGDAIFKVQQSRESGRLYAKRLTEDGFEYAPGAIRSIKASDRMTLEEAKEYGQMTGTCCNCGRTLTNEESIRDGIGPICAGKF